MTATWEQGGLWAAVLVSGLYHGLNPAMGWPLAVSGALITRSARTLPMSLGYLCAGHALAILALTLPFGLLVSLAAWETHIRLAASVLVVAYGIALLVWRRHPRALARIPPSRLAFWSFAVAIAHGAGLMLVPIYLGLCFARGDGGHEAAGALAFGNAGTAALVTAVHTMAMLAAGGSLAWLTFRYLGPQFVARSWFNLDVVWALSLVLVGGASLALLAMH
ncbi:hypothetical protein SAMN04488595_104262 [Ralstonia sp. 25mfcol4.1]|uniref:hypothetical protein n=1 Tax=Burkholderiaceae TaxID=119060 RepID=UPI0008821724|nr:hypothetical protein [Ralstonia sp. 25mfcol4.1]SDP09039.1 hypothetical protein SAMN04488595_104262 [Ralstonia sp. 25mfcol4.1]